MIDGLIARLSYWGNTQVYESGDWTVSLLWMEGWRSSDGKVQRREDLGCCIWSTKAFVRLSVTRSVLIDQNGWSVSRCSDRTRLGLGVFQPR